MKTVLFSLAALAALAVTAGPAAAQYPPPGAYPPPGPSGPMGGYPIYGDGYGGPVTGGYGFGYGGYVTSKLKGGVFGGGVFGGGLFTNHGPLFGGKTGKGGLFGGKSGSGGLFGFFDNAQERAANAQMLPVVDPSSGNAGQLAFPQNPFVRGPRDFFMWEPR